MHECYASQFWPLSCVFVLWETQLLSRGVIRRIRRLALYASYMKESQMWTLDLKVMITAFWSEGITFLKDTEYKTLITLHCVCLILLKFQTLDSNVYPLVQLQAHKVTLIHSLPLFITGVLYCILYLMSQWSQYFMLCNGCCSHNNLLVYDTMYWF
jgi:hypothetical protein